MIRRNLLNPRMACPAVSVIIALFPIFIASRGHGAEPESRSEDLQARVESLQKELAKEREGLSECRAAYKKELGEATKRRGDLAQRLLNDRIRLEQLRQRRRRLERDKSTLVNESMEMRDILDGLLAGARTLAERLDIYLREAPGTEQYLSEVNRALSALPDSGDALDPETFRRSVHALLAVLDQAHRDACYVQVLQVKLRTAPGLLEEVRLLSVGSQAFAYETLDKKRVGLALASPTDASGFRWTEDLAKKHRRELHRAIHQVDAGSPGSVLVPMDVTRRLRVDSGPRNETLLQKLYAGGPVMFPLAAVAILALIIIIERMGWLYWRNPDSTSLVEQVLSACDQGKYDEAERLMAREKGVVPRTLLVCLQRRDQGTRAMEDGIQEQLLHARPYLRRSLSGLAILAGVAPLLGLLGTVTGIIQTFGVIRAFGNANPGLMAGGISEALITTATGLIIAIPVLLCRGALRGRMEKILGDAERHAATLLNVLSRDK